MVRGSLSTLLAGCYSQWPDLIDGSERSRGPHPGEIAFPEYGVEASSGGDTRRSIAIIMEAKRRWAICRLPGNDLDRPYQATKAMSEMMEDYGWNLVALGRKASSHRGRKTGVSVLDALTKGRSRSQIMEWMLVTDEILVARYCEREYIVTPFVAKMFDWMDFRGRAIHCD